MTKRGRLSKEEKSYIEKNLASSAKLIAPDLDRSESIVQKYIDEIAIQEPEEQEPAGQKAGDLMARNEKYGAVTMTETASMAGDESKVSNRESVEEDDEKVNVADRHRGSIHKIKGN